MGTVSALTEASSGVRRLKERVRDHVTPERVLGFLGPWIRRAACEATVSRAEFQAAFVPGGILTLAGRAQAVVWAMEVLREQGLAVDMVPRTEEEVRIRWTKD